MAGNEIVIESVGVELVKGPKIYVRLTIQTRDKTKIVAAMEPMDAIGLREQLINAKIPNIRMPRD